MTESEARTTGASSATVSNRRVGLGALIAFLLPLTLASVPLGLFGSHDVWNASCMLLAVVVVGRVARSRAGLAAVIGLGGTYGVTALVALVSLPWAEECRGGLHNSDCSSLLSFFAVGLGLVVASIGLAFWLGTRDGRIRSRHHEPPNLPRLLPPDA